MKKQWLRIFLGICLALVLLPAAAQAADITSSGTCGENLTWELDSMGVLTIRGSGAMEDYDNYTRCAPWYENRESIHTVTVESGVTSIGVYAFYDCTGLAGVTIPKSVTTIGDSAFDHCTNLPGITIPDNVTSIGDWTFCNCSGLTSVTIPDSVTGIGAGAFQNCVYLAQITLPGKLTSIEEHLFEDCAGLLNITIPESVTHIGYAAFSQCGRLSNVYFTGSQTQWDDIRKDTYNDDLVTVDVHYNYGPSAYPVTGVTLQRDTLGLTVGGTARLSAKVSPEHAYNKNVIWTSSTPDVVSVSDGTVTARKTGRAVITVTTEDGGKTASLTVAVVTGSGKETSDGTCGEDLIWVLDANGTLTVCGSGAMFDYSNYIIDEGVPWYGLRDSIQSVRIEPGVTSIGNYTFWDCGKLTSVTIPESVARIGSFAFRRCRSLTSVTIPGAVTSIGDYAFESCSSLTGVNIPQGATSIGSYAFNDCGSLINITISDCLTSIGSFAFSGCSSLVGIALPENVTSIGNSAFWGCGSLPSITIPDRITGIEEFVFAGCSGLSSVNIPQSVTSIGSHAFSSCDSLKEISYAGSAEQWNSISIGGDNDALASANIHYQDTGSGEIPASPVVEIVDATGSAVHLNLANDKAGICFAAVYDESGKILAVGLQTVEAKAGPAAVTLNAVLPEHYTVRVFFTDPVCAPLCLPVSRAF